MLRVEGENRIDIESLADEIASMYGVSDKKALKFFCTAIQYNVVMEAVFEQIDYLLEQNVISKD